MAAEGGMVAPVISAFGFTHVLKIQTLDLYLEVDNDQFLHRRFYISHYKSCNTKFFMAFLRLLPFCVPDDCWMSFYLLSCHDWPHVSRITSASDIDYYFPHIHDGAQLIEALHYKPEGRGFDSRWCLWKFSLT